MAIFNSFLLVYQRVLAKMLILLAKKWCFDQQKWMNMQQPGFHRAELGDILESSKHVN